jgi:hypothetical protein
MDKETFHKKWYYRVLQVLFWGSLVSLSGGLIILGLSEDDIPAAGFFWAGIVIFTYWIIKKVFYYLMFGERILSRSKFRLVIKLLPVVTTAILGIIWWVNGMEDTWLYLSNVLIVFTVSWAAYPKSLEGEDR